MRDDESPTRAQLAGAREKIAAQLDELHYRDTAAGFARRGGKPDFSGVIAELSRELAEINAILSDPNY